MATTPIFLPGEFHGGEAWQAPVHGVTTSQKQLSNDVSLTHSLSYFNLYEFMFLAFFIK